MQRRVGWHQRHGRPFALRSLSISDRIRVIDTTVSDDLLDLDSNAAVSVPCSIRSWTRAALEVA
jgi:hypothetical protein